MNITQKNKIKRKKSKRINQNLINKFDDVITNKQNLSNCLNLNSEEKSSHNITNEDLVLELRNKINSFKQSINFQELTNQHYIDEVKSFVDFFMKFFSSLGQVDERKFFEMSSNLTQAEEMLKKGWQRGMNESELNEINFTLDIVENFINTLKSKDLKTLISKIQNYDLPFTEKIVEKENLFNLELQNSLRAQVRKNLLSSTKKRNDKLLLENFLQTFLLKSNGVLTESSFCKCDNHLLEEYQKFKFYELKFYFSTAESFNDVQTYMERLKRLYTKYFIVFKQTDKKFLKVTFSGVGRKQKLMKENLKKIVTTVIKGNCVIKLSYYSDLICAIRKSLTKFQAHEECFMYSNFSEGAMRKVLNKC